jgi:hypothetical protein
MTQLGGKKRNTTVDLEKLWISAYSRIAQYSANSVFWLCAVTDYRQIKSRIEVFKPHRSLVVVSNKTGCGAGLTSERPTSDFHFD